MDPWIASTNGTRKPFGEAGAGSGQQELWHRTLSGASWNDVLADLFRQADGYLTHPEEEMGKMKAGNWQRSGERDGDNSDFLMCRMRFPTTMIEV